MLAACPRGPRERPARAGACRRRRTPHPAGGAVALGLRAGDGGEDGAVAEGRSPDPGCPRGRPPADEAALLKVLMGVGRLMADWPLIQAIDINPLMVLPKGRGGRPVDAGKRGEAEP